MPSNQTPQRKAIHMTSLYNANSVIDKLWEQFSEIFSDATKPTATHLFEMALSVFALNGFHSVKYNFEHFIEGVSKYELKSFYYTLNESKIDPQDWRKHLVEAALSICSADTQQPIILTIDDTLIEKYGKKFEHWSKLFDHAAHNGSNYLNGHCLVSLLLSIPVKDASGCRYLSFPVSYKMWTKEQTKLELAAGMVKSAMDYLGTQRRVILCCDSWYPKGCVKELVNEYANLAMICNVRVDTALYALPPEPTGKKGRPRVRGQRLSIESFTQAEIPGTDLCAGFLPVKTNLFGSRTVYAIATKVKDGKSYRLFLCTENPQNLHFDFAFSDERAASFAQADSNFMPLTIYTLRWNIEVSYYEQKTFWALGNYRLRSQTGIERLVNLLTLCYSAMKILPFLSDAFRFLKGLSPQQARFALGQAINREVFFASFVARLETAKYSSKLISILKLQFFGMTHAA